MKSSKDEFSERVIEQWIYVGYLKVLEFFCDDVLNLVDR